MYALSGDAGEVRAATDIATNETMGRVYGVRPENGQIILRVDPDDDPDGTVFAGISLLDMKALHPGDTFLIDFNSNGTTSYPPDQAWNVVTSATALTAYPLSDAAGGSADGIVLTVEDGFSGFRDNNRPAYSGFPVVAEQSLYYGPASMTLSGLDTNRTYDFTFLARRGSVASGFDYSGTYVFDGGGDPVTNITEAATNLNYTVVSGIAPDSTGTIVVSVANGPGAGTDFPVLNVMRMVEVHTGVVAAGVTGLLDDPDADGIPNALEYSQNLDPTTGEANPFSIQNLEAVGGDTSFTASYAINKRASDAQYTIETTTNLVTPAWTTDVAVTESLLMESGSSRIIKIERDMTGPLLFIRLGVEVNP